MAIVSKQMPGCKQLKYAGLIKLAFLLSLSTCNATRWVIPISGDIVGEIQYAKPQYGETLTDLGIRFDMGYNEMRRANPHVDPEAPLNPGVKITIPSAYILPPGKREGIIINLPEYRLYYFPKNDNIVMTYPIGIGRKGWETPVGQTTVIAKQKNPSWRPTQNVIKQGQLDGIPVPSEFPPGPNNPLGHHVLRLGWSTYLIHGAPEANGVGMRISAGCVRMIPNDMAQLYDAVDTGTSVHIINEPIKIGFLNQKKFIEAHPPLDSSQPTKLSKQSKKILQQSCLKHLIEHAEGIPIAISRSCYAAKSFLHRTE